MPNIYTKTGDKGETSLIGGTRVSKDSAKVECYGTVDEALSTLGLAYSVSKNQYVKSCIREIQLLLFSVGAELACEEAALETLQNTVSEHDVTRLEQIIEYCISINGKQTQFVVPGENEASSALHMARTIIRRAERRVIALAVTSPVRQTLRQYLNRLSDALYALARLEETFAQHTALRVKITDLVVQALGANAVQCEEFSLETARQLATLAETKATELGVPIVCSVVDGSANLILLHRMNDALIASIDISMNKAYTACSVKMPTHELGKAALPGESLYGIQHTNQGKIVLFGGGYPILNQQSRVIGAIGVSGGSTEQDMLIASYALENWKGAI